MAKYVRKKNPQGTKQTSLRTQFRNALRNAERRVISDTAFAQAVTGLIGGALPATLGLFKNLNYDELYKKGITREISGKRVTYTGEEAIKLQIQSLNRFGSKTVQGEGFIQNYISTMLKVGFTAEQAGMVSSAMYGVPIDYLTYLIKKGPSSDGLPSIELLYAPYEDDKIQRQEMLIQILNALTYDTEAKAKIREIRAQRTKIRPLLEAQLKIRGHYYNSNTL